MTARFDLSPYLERHSKVALQLSGGKDSLACLELARPWLDRITVYWSNPGDPLPETRARMEAIAASVPHFVEVRSNVLEAIDAHGWPSDVVPVSHTPLGQACGGATAITIQDRYSCCLRSLMLPAFERLVADGVTLCIRGQRADERLRNRVVGNGHVDPATGIEILLPIDSWTSDQVFAFLRERGVEIPAFYDYASSSIDCANCTAYWGEGHEEYLRAKHPELHERRVTRIALIRSAVRQAMKLTEEL